MENLSKVLEEIQDLIKAKELLDELWGELSPYDNRFSNEVMNKMRDHYEFDDSE